MGQNHHKSSSRGEHWDFPVMFPLEKDLLLWCQPQLAVLPLISQDQHLFPRMSFKVSEFQLPEVVSSCTQRNVSPAVASGFQIKLLHVIKSECSNLVAIFWCWWCLCGSTQTLHGLGVPRGGMAGPGKQGRPGAAPAPEHQSAIGQRPRPVARHGQMAAGRGSQDRHGASGPGHWGGCSQGLTWPMPAVLHNESLAEIH